MIFSLGINAEGVWAKLGFCPGRSEFFNIGDKNFGLNAYAELCDVARMHVPWFGTPEFDLNVNNQLKIQVSVLGRHFDVLAAELRAVKVDEEKEEDSGNLRRLSSSSPAYADAVIGSDAVVGRKEADRLGHDFPPPSKSFHRNASWSRNLEEAGTMTPWTPTDEAKRLVVLARWAYAAPEAYGCRSFSEMGFDHPTTGERINGFELFSAIMGTALHMVCSYRHYYLYSSSIWISGLLQEYGKECWYEEESWRAEAFIGTLRLKSESVMALSIRGTDGFWQWLQNLKVL